MSKNWRCSENQAIKRYVLIKFISDRIVLQEKARESGKWTVLKWGCYLDEMSGEDTRDSFLYLRIIHFDF